MWEAIAFGILAAIAGAMVMLLAYWYFVIAPQFEAFRRELETARGEWAAYGDVPHLPPGYWNKVDRLQSKRHAAAPSDERLAS